MRLADVYDRFFQLKAEILRDEAPQLTKDEADAAAEMITLSHMAGYRKLLEWLEREADRPVAPRSEVVEMVTGLARQNTLKEVRDRLKSWVAEANETMKRHKEGHNG